VFNLLYPQRKSQSLLYFQLFFRVTANEYLAGQRQDHLQCADRPEVEMAAGGLQREGWRTHSNPQAQEERGHGKVPRPHRGHLRRGWRRQVGQVNVLEGYISSRGDSRLRILESTNTGWEMIHKYVFNN
jgi:hypothetical protein